MSDSFAEPLQPAPRRLQPSAFSPQPVPSQPAPGPLQPSAFSLQPNKLFDNTVAVVDTGLKEYPSLLPFDPDQFYPEFASFPYTVILGPANRVYAGVREAFRLLGLDKEKYGTAAWNPLGDLIKPGNKVVVKPNFALDFHRGGETVFSIITHPSVLRPILDYAQLALKGKGGLMIGDAPVTDANWDNLVKVSGVGEMLESLNRIYPIPVALRDWRKVVVKGYDQNNLFLYRTIQEYGAKRSVVVNLGRRSAFFGLPRETEKLYYGADFDRRVPQSHHRGEVQEYSVAADVLEADVVISVPKLKTHKSAGVTLNVKNAVGINTDKNFLPHYRIGEPRDGGDEYPNTEGNWLRFKGKLARIFIDISLGRLGRVCASPLNRILSLYRRRALGECSADRTQDTADLVYERLLGRKIRCGHWWGNDTLWRVGADLNRILIYAGKDGMAKDRPQRAYLSVMDAIIGGEGKGPMVPGATRAGLILGGFNPLAVDSTAAIVMGFSPEKIPVVVRVGNSAGVPLKGDAPINLITSKTPRQGLPGYAGSRAFAPAPNWVGHIELA